MSFPQTIAATFAALSISPVFAELVISEFMASNSTTLADEDGHFSDWIEITNTGSEVVGLENYLLTTEFDFSVNDPDSVWVFPARSLGPGSSLVVFASSKNRRSAGGELHTNFQLAAGGEYLALIAADGTSVLTEFAPQYPRQRSDISYGQGQAVLAEVALVSEGDLAKVQVARDGSAGTGWTGGSEPFADGGWLERATGVGFEQGSLPGGFTLIENFDGLNQGEIDGQGGWSSPVVGATIVPDPADVENSVLSQVGPLVRTWKALPIANNTTATVFFRMRRDGAVNASLGGSDVGNPGTNFADFETQLNNQNDSTLNVRDGGSFDAVSAIEDGVWYDVWLVTDLTRDTYEVHMQGGALSEQTLLRNGGQTRFSFRNGSSGNAFESFFIRTGLSSPGSLLLDDLHVAEGENLGNPAGSPGVSGFIAEGGDLESEMLGQASGAYLRLPFTTPTAGSLASLTLGMRYDDGFVAYLNGTQVAAQNAPASPGWNASATTDRSVQDAIVYEDYDLSSFQDLLKPVGEENILAIHALNLSANDADFLISPVLAAVPQVETEGAVFFTEPTPGAGNGEGVLGFVSDTEFSLDRGFYEAPFDLVIDSDTEGSTVIYTLDGSAPSSTNGVAAPAPVTLTISKTTPVRALAQKVGFLPTDIDTQTYFFLDDIIAQPDFPAGYPTTWKGDNGNGFETADYGMDPEITQSAAYQDQMNDALLSIPTISIVTDRDHLFAPGAGIYQNPQQRGSAWERPTSVEFIRPDGRVEDIQVNAGLRIQGGHTRFPSRNPKHSFRLSFKEKFGPKSLNYELFPGDDGATQKFDQIILRGSGNQSWLHHNTFKGDNRGRAQYLRDQWAKDTQLAMNGVGLRSMYAHLYINGIYWGMYNPTERATAAFGESYFGETKEDYNALNAGEGIDGDNARGDYEQMLALANRDLSEPANYAALQEALNVPLLTDYMIINQYGANLDWDHQNWYAIRNRNGNSAVAAWTFICWDSEFVFIDENDNVLGLDNADDPSGIWRNLMENEEYRLFFADRVQEHLANDGLLTPGGVLKIWEARKDQMFEAIVAESARWGDYRRDVDPVGTPSPIPLYDRDEEWMAERNRLLNNYFPTRTATVLQQYRSAGYLPSFAAPVFNLPAGQVAPASLLQITSPDGGDIFYTIDGTDPRTPGNSGVRDLVAEGDGMKAFVATDDNLGTSWHGGAEPFDDSGWLSGAAAGYEASGRDYAGLFDLDLQSTMYQQTPSCFVRFVFNIPDQATLDQIVQLTLGVRYDDGFAAFINGVSVASDNAPSPLTWANGNGSHDDSLAKVYQPFTLPSAALSALQVGQNVLAIHAFNSSAGSNDFLIDAILSAGLEIDSVTAPGALSYSGPISLNGSTMVQARVRDGDSWSALTSAVYSTASPAAFGNLVISEVMYHPSGDGAAEFLEFENISSTDLDLTGVYLSEGVDFTFPLGTTLAPAGRVLVVRDLAAFTAVYGAGFEIAGIFQNDTGLSNAGERLTLKARDGAVIQSFEYDDRAPWALGADGDGSSLVLRRPSTLPDSENAENWRSSLASGGNPGTTDGIIFGGVAGDDLDGDGLTALMEYALGTSDNDPAGAAQALTIRGSVISWQQASGADDASLTLEVSRDLATWNPATAEDVAPPVITPLVGGRSQVTHESLPNFDRIFFRLKVNGR